MITALTTGVVPSPGKLMPLCRFDAGGDAEGVDDQGCSWRADVTLEHAQEVRGDPAVGDGTPHGLAALVVKRKTRLGMDEGRHLG
jgi:hypothetical protein